MATSTSTVSAQREAATPTKHNKRVAIWLFFMCGLVAAMVIVGGATRLTDSGLSITEWKPVTGAVPPLSEEAWLTEFEKYKQIPEYVEVNFGMSLSEFKNIYWWEWGHRMLGRVIGLAFLFPFSIFALTGALTRRLSLQLFGLFVLGGMQGALGWWMVASGLVDRVDVSQYRLAAHLTLAIILFALMFWLALNLWSGGRKGKVSGKLKVAAAALSLGVLFQIVLGAFVAGLRAGKTFNTWPLMDGKIVPEGYFIGSPGLNDLFESIAAVQFNHRLGAYLVTIGAVWFWFAARRSPLSNRASLLLATVIVQVTLGIWTVLAATPINLGLLHQAGALAVLASSLYALHGANSSSIRSVD